MAVTGMNHFTILTDDLDRALAFCAEHLGLRSGPRPPFAFSGAWLYAEGGSEAILHVIAGRPREELDRNGARVEVDFDPGEAAPA